MTNKGNECPLQVELLGGSTSRCPVHWQLTKWDITHDRLSCRIEADAQTGQFRLFKSGKPVYASAPLPKATAFTGISFRTGLPRPITDRATMSVTNDAPVEQTSYTIQRLTIQ
jgi:hypothetical protein